MLENVSLNTLPTILMYIYVPRVHTYTSLVGKGLNLKLLKIFVQHGVQRCRAINVAACWPRLNTMLNDVGLSLNLLKPREGTRHNVKNQHTRFTEARII